MPIYTQGLMDLGATVCTLRRPACAACPLADRCVAAREGQPERYPVKTRRLRRSRQTLWLLHAVDGQGRVWLARRPATGIWARLHCLPQYASSDDLMRDVPEPARATAVMHAPFTHVLTHRDLDIHVVSVRLPASAQRADEGRWRAAADWAALGLPAPVRRFLERGG
jgi:A/G-specific adenine glycosylase